MFFNPEVMAEVIAAVRAESTDELQHTVKLLNAEIAGLKGVLAELRLALSAERAAKTKGEPFEALPSTRRELN
jgi:hypothetical protein